MGIEVESQESVLEETEVELEEERDGDLDSEKKEETPEESVKLALEELRSKSSGDSEEKEEETEQGSKDKPVQQLDPTKKEVKGQKANEKPESEDEEEFLDPDLVAPERFKPHEKMWFNKITQKGLKKAISRSVRELEGVMTRATQEVAKEREEIQGIREVVKPYIELFAERDLSIEQGIRALLVAQKKLTDDSNPKLQRDTWLQIGRDIGMDISSFKSAEDGDSVDISNHPVVKELKNEILALRKEAEPYINQNKQVSEKQFTEAYQTTLQELEGVQNEMDASGNLLRPELHDATFLNSWKPLVSGLVKSKKLAYRDAAIQAYSLLTGKSFTQPNRARIPAANNQNSNRAVSAAVSVRGRVNTPVSFESEEEAEDVPSDETPEQSVRRALATIRARN